ncbi:hypothetical protein PPERSA_05593 [Pseudocohnilembus persalinus]|uniref:Uncharacterized protein n=1 Tax=Pseudocohnilembus persalinus TaxID=266149 RepID=A0A0V0Q7N7_PSEPJ|nr:hypothetical protein PPERSA_05593 [Pseudocohnilembus persalinus]|eukprot:KRW98249.1 hypothetical protein PPERSA_05593 [Pseudocohnilembus persalinus]
MNKLKNLIILLLLISFSFQFQSHSTKQTEKQNEQLDNNQQNQDNNNISNKNDYDNQENDSELNKIGNQINKKLNEAEQKVEEYFSKDNSDKKHDYRKDIVDITGRSILDRQIFQNTESWCYKSLSECLINSNCKSCYEDTKICIYENTRTTDKLLNNSKQCFQNVFYKYKEQNALSVNKWSKKWENLDECFQYSFEIQLQKK